MKRSILACALFVAATAVAGAQDASPYQGTSNPPSDDQITTSSTPEAKPPAGQPKAVQPAVSAPAEPLTEAQPVRMPPPILSTPAMTAALCMLRPTCRRFQLWWNVP